MNAAPLRRRFAASLAGLCLLLAAAIALAMTTGALHVPLRDVARALASTLGSTRAGDLDPAASHVVLFVRAPRIVLALVTGGMLGAAGAAVQGTFRNPLADPGILGISSGAALGAAIHIVVGTRLFHGATAWTFGLPLAAFAGGISAAALAGGLGGSGPSRNAATLILAGVGINAAAGASVGLLTFIANDAQLRDLSFWLLGSLGGATWQRLLVTAPLAVACTLALLAFGRALNVLALGEADAAHAGLHVRRTRATLLVVAALGVSATVAVTGPLGFVGLIVPHAARLLFGADARRVLPAATLLGAVLLVLADIAARTVVAPAELPTGVVTSALGAPFFLVLLRSRTTAA